MLSGAMAHRFSCSMAASANTEYFGGQVPELAKQYKVIAMDSRGHGRSSRDAQPYSYA